MVTYVRWLVVVKCFCVWPINSCVLIWDSVCIVDTTIFKRYVGSDKKISMTFVFVRNREGKDAFSYFINEQMTSYPPPPPFFVIYFKSKVRCCSIFIRVCILKRSMYSPKCHYGRLWDFIWWYATRSQVSNIPQFCLWSMTKCRRPLAIVVSLFQLTAIRKHLYANRQFHWNIFIG